MPCDELTRDLDVLVVEDELTVRELLLEYFDGHGFRVSGAEDGGSAIGLLQRGAGRFGLVVTDLNLPGADGFAVLQAARQINPQCFVVIITGYASLDSAIRAVRVGAYDYLTKPFSLAQLDIILARIRERWAQQRGQPSSSAPAPAVAADRGEVPRYGTAGLLDAGQRVPAALSDDRPVAAVEIVAPAPTYPGLASYNVAQRLGLLEAAFGRIEALLRDRS